MKTTIYSIVSILLYHSLWAQVGINTTSPQATLDINGNLKVRTIPETTTFTGYKLLAVNTSTTEVTQASLSLLDSNLGATLSRASVNTSLSLLDLNISLLTGWNLLKLDTFSASPNNFTSTATDFYYTVPANGYYHINFGFRQKSAVGLSLGFPQMGIVKTTGTDSTLLDSKNTYILTASLISTTYGEIIDYVYLLQAGDKIRLVYNKGALSISLGVLSDSSATFTIYKVSNN